MGQLVQDYWRQYAKKHNLPVEVEDGYPALSTFKFNHPLTQELRTLYTQYMLDRGFLAGVALYTTWAHTESVMSLYGFAIDEVFEKIAAALSNDTVNQELKGPVAHSGFARLL